jgi:hypothetical protein
MPNLHTCGHTVHSQCLKAVSKAHQSSLLKIFHKFHHAHLKKPAVTSHSKGAQKIGKSVYISAILKLMNNKIKNYFLHKEYLLNTGKYSEQIAF